ncbi:MAG: ABC transporter substrate-binding protein [Chloroflexota bacterium]
MWRERVTRRAMMQRTAALAALGGPLALLTACGQSAAPAKPAAPAQGSAPAPTTAPAVKPAESKPAEVAKPAEAKPAAAAKPTAPEDLQVLATGAPKRGGTLKAVVVNDFVTMWPAITTGPTARMCYDWLVRWAKGADGKWGPAPMLAESWDITDKAATFKLRRGVKFHDGSDFNAEAVRWNVETWIKHPKSLAKSDLAFIATDTPAEVVDDYTVKINLKAPAGPLLATLSNAFRTTGIVSKTAYEKLGDAGLNLQAVGTGPFMWESFQSGAQLVVKKNPNYWAKGADGQPLPYLDGVTYRFVPDDSVRFTEVRSGNADICELIRGRDVPAVKQDPNLVYFEDPTAGILHRFFFNGKQGIFKDNLKLRQAIHHAFDREAMAKALGAGLGAVQYYELTPAAVGFDATLPKYEFDLDKAKKLIAESGVKTPLDVRLTVITREIDQQQAQMMAQMLDKIGIKINIESLERVAWGQKVRQANDFEMATQRTDSRIDPDQMTLPWSADGPAAYIRTDAPGVNSCLDEGRSTTDATKRQAIYAKCQTAMHDSAFWGHMWLLKWNYLMNKRVKTPAPFFQEMWMEETLFLEG